MLRVIKVYGSLAKFLGAKSFRADVKSPAEAVQFLRANFPGLPAHMADKHYKISVGRHELDAGEQPEQLAYPSGQAEPIRIVPVIAGAGSGTAKIIAGIAIIALSFGIGAIASAGVTLGGLAGIGTVATYTAGLGLSLALTGVAQLLTPTPTSASPMMQRQENATDPRSSYSFSGIQNVSRQGIPVPLVYGSAMTGSVVISAGINTEQI